MGLCTQGNGRVGSLRADERVEPMTTRYTILAEFLGDNLEAIPFNQSVNKVVAVHDSCSVARLWTFELTRTLLRAVPGITLVEMEQNRENSLCCRPAIPLLPIRGWPSPGPKLSPPG